MTTLAHEVRLALRGFAKSPGFAAVAILTLALGIGANTAIFSVADALLLRPLPYSQPDSLVVISAQKKGAPFTLGPLSWIRFQQLNRDSRSFLGIAAFTNEVFNLTGGDNPEQLIAARVSWNFLPVLGVQPALGRGFTAEEDQPGGPLVALVSDDLWRRQLGANRSAIGSHLTLDQNDYTIIGVLPAGFRFGLLSLKMDLITTRLFDLNLATPQQIQAGAGFLNAVARLRAGASREQAQAEMDTLAAQYRRERPGFPDADPAMTVRVDNLQAGIVANFRPAVLILF